MSTPKNIPIQAGAPAQSFSIVLNDVGYNMSAKWNSRAEFWTLDIADEDGTVILSNIALRAGLDLLAPFNLGMGSLHVYDVSETGKEATLNNIGTDVVLVYMEPD